ncbi:MAG: hypothetical protein KJO51_05580, partial [Gramella sp.]|nr:hypothetical protein [Christiangramia sp.]
MKTRNVHPLLCVLLFFLSVQWTVAQEELTSDELFIKARTAAFDEDDYPKAIELTQLALQKSPSYA